MEIKLPATCGVEAVDPRVIQHIGPVSSVRPQSEVVDVRSNSSLEDGNQFMFRAIETALAGIALVPDQKVLPAGIERPGGAEQFRKMAPVHENIIDASILAEADGAADESLEKSRERCFRHFARGDLEFPMAHLAAAHRVAVDAHIVGRVSDHHLSEFAPQQTFVGFRSPGIAANQAMPTQLPNITGLADRRSIERIA
jgi:hypothetical protein